MQSAEAVTARPDPAPLLPADAKEGRAVLERILAAPEAVLAQVSLLRTPLRYERNFLFGDERLSVWAMTWAPGSATAIHDHHCSCCFGIVSGELVERRFMQIDAAHAVQTFERVRGPGFLACMEPTGPNIHQMVNVGEVEAISIHVYGFDRDRRSSSVHREYRACGGAVSLAVEARALPSRR